MSSFTFQFGSSVPLVHFPFTFRFPLPDSTLFGQVTLTQANIMPLTYPTNGPHHIPASVTSEPGVQSPLQSRFDDPPPYSPDVQEIPPPRSSHSDDSDEENIPPLEPIPQNPRARPSAMDLARDMIRAEVLESAREEGFRTVRFRGDSPYLVNDWADVLGNDRTILTELSSLIRLFSDQSYPLEVPADIYTPTFVYENRVFPPLERNSDMYDRRIPLHILRELTPINTAERNHLASVVLASGNFSIMQNIERLRRIIVHQASLLAALLNLSYERRDIETRLMVSGIDEVWDHVRFDPRTPRPPPNTRCTSCTRTGHTAVECPGIVCSRCRVWHVDGPCPVSIILQWGILHAPDARNSSAPRAQT